MFDVATQEHLQTLYLFGKSVTYLVVDGDHSTIFGGASQAKYCIGY